jgi:hypothetical protein
MSCFDGNSALVLTPKSNGPQDIAIIETWQLSRPTITCFDARAGRHPKPTPNRNMSSFGKQLDTSFDAWATRDLIHIAHRNM